MHLVKFKDSEDKIHYGIQVDDDMIICGCCSSKFCLEDGDEAVVIDHYWAEMEEVIKEVMEK